jgi:hypothetical protein
MEGQLFRNAREAERAAFQFAQGIQAAVTP